MIQDVCTLCDTTATVTVYLRYLSSDFVQLSPEVLDLHNRFECGGGWGLERTFHAWVNTQPWRQLMPVRYFEFPVCIYSIDITCTDVLNPLLSWFFHWSIGPRFDVPAAPVSWLLPCSPQLKLSNWSFRLAVSSLQQPLQPRYGKDMLAESAPKVQWSKVWCYLMTLRLQCTAMMVANSSSVHGLVFLGNLVNFVLASPMHDVWTCQMFGL